MKSSTENRSVFRTVLVVFGMNMLGLLYAAGLSSAGPVSDIPNGLNGALFDGANLFATQAILTALVMITVGFSLAVMRLNYIAVMIVLLAVLGALTAIGWAPPIILLLSAFLIVALFVKRAAEYFTGHGGGEAKDE